MVLICLEQKISIQTYSLKNLIIAILCCIAAGVSLAANNIYAKKLSKSGFSPFDILAIRFILLIAITGIISYQRIHEIFKIEILENILFNAFSLIVIPQIIFQYSLKELEPITISIISPLMPVMIFIVEIFSNKINPNFITILGIFFICLASMAGAKIRYHLHRVSYQSINDSSQKLKQQAL
ncbi:MAG TPA: DMT family transporter [Patescibacteria group bacterium]|nr:DMT family transporter [Gammaproteobacteria bacterium]HWA51548.1 DMT family transporter [Patescibacteria group bacterium]